MNIDLTETEIETITKALEFYYHYTIAQKREDGSYLDLADKTEERRPAPGNSVGTCSTSQKGIPERQKKRG